MTAEARHSTLFRVVAVASAALFCVLFAGLGTWQIERRAWKLDLIARVEARVHAPPASLPDPALWSLVTPQSDEYRHVSASGVYLDQRQTLVQAVTELGAGYWVMTPLRLEDGHVVLVNRGFVPVEGRAQVAPGGSGQVTGLIRMSEPGGAFLRHNNPSEDRWYSRDVQEIARVRGFSEVAPFFIDADVDADADAHSKSVADPSAPVAAAAIHGVPGATSRPAAPVGGLTVVRFHNSHLVYAITWYTLALMSAGGAWALIRHEANS